MNLSESIINSAAKAIEDSTVKLGDKDLHTELQLGELKLSTLDKKIDECLENSRKALSMNDICSQRANNILSPERRILLDSSTTSPYGRSSNGGSPLRNMSSLSLSVTKKPSDRSLKSLALTRETTQEESGAPVEIRQGGKLKSPETRIRTDGRISVRDLTGLDLSQRVQHNNIISGERNRVGRIMNPKLGAKTSNRYVSEENKTHNNNSAPETQSSPAGEERKEIEIITNYEVLERPINEKGDDSLERKYGKVRGSSGESNDREYSEYLKPKSATHSFQSPKPRAQKTELGLSFTQKGFFLSPKKNNFSSPNFKGKNVGHFEARNFLSPNMKRTRPASNKSMDMQNYEKALRNPSQRGENTVINNKKEEQKGSHQNQRKEKRKNFSVAGTSDFKSKQDLRNLLSVDRNSQGKLIQRVNETSNVGKDYRGLHNSDMKIGLETDETLLSQVQRSFHETSSIMRNSKGKRKSQDGRESIDVEPVEVHFTKAFSLVKNKIINQGATFEERMKSDLYFRRRFENE